MPTAVAKKRAKRSQVSRLDFIGTQMANFLHGLKYENGLPEFKRKQAIILQERWDSVCSFRLNNPIVASDLEKELFPNG